MRALARSADAFSWAAASGPSGPMLPNRRKISVRSISSRAAASGMLSFFSELQIYCEIASSGGRRLRAM